MPKKKIPQSFPVWERPDRRYEAIIENCVPGRAVELEDTNSKAKRCFTFRLTFAFIFSCPLYLYKGCFTYNTFIRIVNYLYDIGAG